MFLLNTAMLPDCLNVYSKNSWICYSDFMRRSVKNIVNSLADVRAIKEQTFCVLGVLEIINNETVWNPKWFANWSPKFVGPCPGTYNQAMHQLTQVNK